MSDKLSEEIERIQEIINEWLEAIAIDDKFYPRTWALEKLWMDLNILKRHVRITFASLDRGEDPEAL